MLKNFLVVVTVLLTTLGSYGQIGGVKVDYNNPKDYTVGGITVDGIRHLDANAIILLSGLSVGDQISVPGDRISKAIRSLWKQQLFSDVKIKTTRIQGNTIFLSFQLKERPRLSKFKFNGVSKSEADDLREAIKLFTGKIVTENVVTNTKNTVRNFFVNKGFYRVKTEIKEIVDTTINNSVILAINVRKGSKIKVNAINFTGNESLSDKQLRRAMKETKIKRGYRLFASSKFIKKAYEGDKKSVVGRYNTAGFRDAQILRDSVYRYDDKTMNIDIDIDEGRKYYFRNITWAGNTKHTSSFLSKVLGIEKGDIYNRSILESRLYQDAAGRDITSVYMDDGYLFFSVQPVEILVENDSIDFEMRIIEGKQARVNRVTITGNTKTNDHVILREIRVKPGDLFSRAAILRTQRELANLGYFNAETLNVIPTPNPQNGTVDIEFIVEERPSDQFEVSGGWGAGRVVGTLGLSFNNFSLRNFFKKEAWQPLPAGDGQRLSIRAQSNGVFFQSYNLSFTEPWLGGKKRNSFSITGFHSVQTNGERRFIDDTEGNRVENPARRWLTITGVSVGLGKQLQWPDDYFTSFQEISYQHYSLNDFGTLFAFSDGKANNLSFRFTIQRNSINKPIYPDNGSNITLTAKFTPPFSLWDGVDDYSTLTDQERYRWIEFHKWKFTSEWFTPLTTGEKKLVLRSKIGFGFLGLYNRSLGAAPFERFYLGGSALTGFSLDGREIIALRGYDDLSVSPDFGGTIVSKYTTELRFPLSLNQAATIYMLAFAEAGNTWDNFREFNPFAVKRSAGLGVRIFLPAFGLLGLDYGLGFDTLENTPGFVPFGTSRQGQFHFTIGMNLGEL